MKALQMIEMMAGLDAKAQPVMEKLPVHIDDQNQCELSQSPAFVKGVAKGDVVKLNDQTHQFEVVKRSGNLCIRVFSRGDIEALSDTITPEIEKLGGTLDIESPRLLVYSIHVSCGFTAIEAILNRHTEGDDHAWLYGNVYDPADGTTPLNWWIPILQPE